jgi:hypothetical protein
VLNGIGLVFPVGAVAAMASVRLGDILAFLLHHPCQVLDSVGCLIQARRRPYLVLLAELMIPHLRGLGAKRAPAHLIRSVRRILMMCPF